jgi:hypothetical protein
MQKKAHFPATETTAFILYMKHQRLRRHLSSASQPEMDESLSLLGIDDMP